MRKLLIKKKSNSKNILVIGGSGGIGGEVVKFFFQEGHKVISTYNETCPPPDQNNIINIKLDLSDVNSIEKFIKNLEIELPTNLDSIIFTATSYSAVGKIENQNTENVKTDYFINIIGPHLVLKMLRKRIKPHAHSSVIFLLGGGQGPKDSLSTYIASKWALIGLIDSLSEELAIDKINVIGLYPGPYKTKFLTKLMSLGSEVISSELLSHVTKNSQIYTKISEELLKSLNFILNINLDFSAKIISARYDKVYERSRTELLNPKLFKFIRHN